VVRCGCRRAVRGACRACLPSVKQRRFTGPLSLTTA
jgi:hypothetical protein